MGPDFAALAVLSVATASLATFVSEAKVLSWLRLWVDRKWEWGGEMLRCGYCVGHWVALCLVLLSGLTLFEPLRVGYLLDVVLTTFSVAWIAAFQWAAFRWLLKAIGE